MEEKIRKKLEEHDIPKEVQTPAEIEQLKDEIRAEEDGYVVLDGVLFNPELQIRAMLYLEENNMKTTDDV